MASSRVAEVGLLAFMLTPKVLALRLAGSTRRRPVLRVIETICSPLSRTRALSAGRTLGDAAYYALPALSWQTIVIGDPLYRPFAVSLDAQLANVGALPPALAPYVLLRKARLLERDLGREGLDR